MSKYSNDQLMRVTTAYLAEPSRSERNQVSWELASAGFFSATNPDEMEKALKKVLDIYESRCPDGARRAKRYFSDNGITFSTPVQTTTVRVVVDIEVEGLKEGDPDYHIAGNLGRFVDEAVKSGTLKASTELVKLKSAKYKTYRVGGLIQNLVRGDL